VAEALPEVKLIVLLRNPVDRAYSHFQFESRIGKETLSFEQAIERERQHFESEAQKVQQNDDYRSDIYSRFSYLARGRYLEQIRRWREFFPEEQFLILQSEKLYRDSEDVLRQVCGFLGVQNSLISDRKTYNAAEYNPMPEAIQKRLEAYFLPYNQQLSEFLGQSFEWDAKGTDK
jgi:hypothetical protein